MNIRKTKPWRLSIVLYQRRRHLTHALSGLRRRPLPRCTNRERPGKTVGQTIIKNYIERKREPATLNAAQLLGFMKSSRIQKELDNSTNRSIDTRLGAEYRYYRSRPSLALHMTREITRQLICHVPPYAKPNNTGDTQASLLSGNKRQTEESEKVKIIREEFVLTPQLLRIISDKVASGIFRSMELERLRSGL